MSVRVCITSRSSGQTDCVWLTRVPNVGELVEVEVGMEPVRIEEVCHLAREGGPSATLTAL